MTALKTFLRRAFAFPTTVEELRAPRLVLPKLVLAALLGALWLAVWTALPDDTSDSSPVWLVLLGFAGLGCLGLAVSALQIAADRSALLPGSLMNKLNCALTRLFVWRRTRCPHCGRQAPYRQVAGAPGGRRYACLCCFSTWDVPLAEGTETMTKPNRPAVADGAATSPLSLFERVADYLSANDWKFLSHDEAGYIEMSVGITDASVRVLIDVAENGGWQRCGVYAILPARVPEQRRAAALEAINRINFRLAYGNLEMDMGDGEVRVRTGVEAGMAIPEAMLEHALHASIRIADRYFAPLMAVAFSGAAAETVFDFAAGERSGPLH